MSARRVRRAVVIAALSTGAPAMLFAGCSFPQDGDVECTVSECRGADAVTCTNTSDIYPSGLVQTCPAGSICAMAPATDAEKKLQKLGPEALAPHCLVEPAAPCGAGGDSHLAGDVFCDGAFPTTCVALADGTLGRVRIGNACLPGTKCIATPIVACVEEPETPCTGEDQYDSSCDGNVYRYCATTGGFAEWARLDCGTRFCNASEAKCTFHPPEK